jgi:hypothetical protein
MLPPPSSCRWRRCRGWDEGIRRRCCALLRFSSRRGGVAAITCTAAIDYVVHSVAITHRQHTAQRHEPQRGIRPSGQGSASGCQKRSSGGRPHVSWGEHRLTLKRLRPKGLRRPRPATPALPSSSAPYPHALAPTPPSHLLPPVSTSTDPPRHANCSC